jgi:hypothetical protein
MKYLYILLLCTVTNFYAQNNIEVVKNEYLLNTIKLNTNKKLTFFDTYSEIESEDYLNLIKSRFKDKIIINEITNQPITISNNCKEKAINTNIFILKIKNSSLDNQKKGEGEFIPSKVTLTYRWKIIDNYLFFIFTNRPLNDDLQKFIYLP